MKAFGSFATRLYLPISDIDLVVIGGAEGEEALRALAEELRAKNIADEKQIEVIAHARIPIVKLTDKQTGLKVDICFGIDGGIKAVALIQSLVQRMPALRPLTLLLKYFLNCRLLNDTYSGTHRALHCVVLLISLAVL